MPTHPKGTITASICAGADRGRCPGRRRCRRNRLGDAQAVSFWIAQVLIGALVLAEIVHTTTTLVLARRGAGVSARAIDDVVSYHPIQAVRDHITSSTCPTAAPGAST